MGRSTEGRGGQFWEENSKMAEGASFMKGGTNHYDQSPREVKAKEGGS